MFALYVAVAVCVCVLFTNGWPLSIQNPPLFLTYSPDSELEKLAMLIPDNGILFLAVYVVTNSLAVLG